MDRTKRLIIGVLAADLMTNTTARAAPIQSVSQTISFAAFSGFGTQSGSSVNPFDAALGTLQEVDVDSVTTQTVTGASTDALQEVGYSLDIGGLVIDAGTSAASNSHGFTDSFDALLSFATFQGAGPLSTSITVSNVDANAGVVHDVFGPDTLTYYYTAPTPPTTGVPEPASIALLAAAAAGLLLAKRHRGRGAVQQTGARR